MWDSTTWKHHEPCWVLLMLQVPETPFYLYSKNR